MHFIGMSALTLTDPQGKIVTMRLNILVTLVSLATVTLLTFAGLTISSSDRLFKSDKKDTIRNFIKDAITMSIEDIKKIPHKNTIILKSLLQNFRNLGAGGIVMAAGVCVMHYVGMHALVFDGEIVWQPGIVAASVIIAVVAATAAFWILFRVLSLFPNVEILRIACAAVMAVAVNGMHYTGMAAATFVYTEGKTTPEVTEASVTMSSAVTSALTASIVFMFFTFMIANSDLRMWYNNLALVVAEADNQATSLSDRDDTKGEVFLQVYQKLRSLDGSERELLEFKNYISQFHSASASMSPHSADHSRVHPHSDNGSVDSADDAAAAMLSVSVGQ